MTNLKEDIIMAIVIAEATVVNKKVRLSPLSLTFNATIVKLTMTH